MKRAVYESNWCYFLIYYSVDKRSIEANIWAAHHLDKSCKCNQCHFSLHPPLQFRKCKYFCDIYLRYIFYLTFKSKLSGKIFLRSKSSRCNLTFFSVNLFWDGADLKSPPFCHQNPLWKAHSCNLCRNDAENFPSKPSPDEQASVGKPWHMWTAKRLHIYFMNQ